MIESGNDKNDLMTFLGAHVKIEIWGSWNNLVGPLGVGPGFILLV